MRAIPKLVLAAAMLAAPAAQAADVAGAKDHASIKRYEGSEIVNQKTRNYDEYILALGAGAPGSDFEKSQKLEGKLQRTMYRVPAGHTTIEITRNYEQALKDAGFEILHLQQADNFGWYNYFGNRFYLQTLTELSGGETNPLHASFVRQARYIAAKRTVADQDVYAAVLVVESLGTEWVYEPNMKGTSIKVMSGEILVALDVIETKHVENKMVEIKSEEMAKALAEKGSVDIYGIYFDTDKTDLKPESAPTLEEVAKLLKGDTALKLQVAGHTDNTGTKDHNQKLSEGRAQAVVAALTGQYAVDSGRLESKGYGDSKPVASNDTKEGKAKNRRVELVKI